jgi:hypothetical protein
VQLEGGGDPITRAEATAAAISMERRLQLVSRALLLYSQWYALDDSVLPPIFFEHNSGAI